jgi:hypothetical protein
MARRNGPGRAPRHLPVEDGLGLPSELTRLLDALALSTQRRELLRDEQGDDRDDDGDEQNDAREQRVQQRRAGPTVGDEQLRSRWQGCHRAQREREHRDQERQDDHPPVAGEQEPAPRAGAVGIRRHAHRRSAVR